MNFLFKPSITVFSLFFGLAIVDFIRTEEKSVIIAPKENPKIQVAILLDVSGSMNGLIEQAKAQLWNMVTVMGKAKCEQGNPMIEIALYEYGRTTNDVNAGYIKQISPFSSDLDQLSQELFKLNTDGGDEYCGHVIKTSLSELTWDTASTNYKVIFIAGNESFLQGNVSWTEACKLAKSKGVIVNTIYCGDKAKGIQEHWNIVGECGTGSYTNIEHNYVDEYIPTPYDSSLFLLNTQLNSTYIGYGNLGEAGASKQAHVDLLNVSQSRRTAAQRIAVKAKGAYNNSSWDLIDAVKSDSTFIAVVDMKTLPDSLKKKSRAELKETVRQMTAQRNSIQEEIQKINGKRESYVAAEKKKKAQNSVSTLETEVENIIRQQVQRFNMKIE